VAVRNLLARGSGALRSLSIGSMSAEEVYAYPAYEPLRQSFTVSYVRQDGTNHWQARTTPNELHRNVRIKGAVAYSTARYAGETQEDEKHASVTVLLEIGPRFDDLGILGDPNVRSVMVTQAREEANELFRSYHPDAVVEHTCVEALMAPPSR
jgi:hypothetical protein